MSPERYEGKGVDATSDQYYLGLLGLELHYGNAPVDVATFADLEVKRHFFESPRSYFGKLLLDEPAFSFVLAKMLERKPENCWPSMSNLVGILQQLESGTVPDVVKEYADEVYVHKLRNNKAFFASFYNKLFEYSEEIAKLFGSRGVSMDDQYRKLDRAMETILAFNQRLRATTLEPHVETTDTSVLGPSILGFSERPFWSSSRDAGPD